MKNLIFIIVFMMLVFTCESQIFDIQSQVIKESISYKNIGGSSLKLHVFTTNKKQVKPVIVFFHPGGWISGDPAFFFQKAKEYSLLGFHTISVQYRLANLKTSTPKDCLEDSIDALKYLNKHKVSMNLDMSNLFLIGYSAGGHLALMTQLGEDKSIPLAKKIFTIASPMLLEEDELLKRSTMTLSDKKDISPYHQIENLKSKLYSFIGTKDEYISHSTILDFSNKAMQLNKDLKIITFKNAGHFLLNTIHREKIEQRIKEEIKKE